METKVDGVEVGVQRMSMSVRAATRVGSTALIAVTPLVIIGASSVSSSGLEPAVWGSLLSGYLLGGMFSISLLFLQRREDRVNPSHIPQELPAAPPLFLGRDDAVASTVAYLRHRPAEGPRLVLISGAPGIGKTAFALHVGHRVAENFPDGQLFASLDARGRDPEEVLHAALARFLTALGYPVEDGPDGWLRCQQTFQQVMAT
jgi:hypothetical protein